MLAVALAAAPVAAEPVNKQPSVFGVQGGRVQTAAEADNGIDASDTLGLFVRKGFSHRWALQFDLSRTRQDDWSIISSTASVMHAFGDSKRLVPMVRGGVGFDTSDDTGAVHAEAAAVLELRLDGGLVLGADLSIGARNSPGVNCAYDGYDSQVGPNTCGGESVFRSTYRAAKLTLGMAF
ncbi:MAG: hypothetical protein ABIY55_21910 [Kofleriaceae bacterium]